MIAVSPGPEDFALDTDGPRGPRLLVAATNRGKPKGEVGKFWSVDLTGPGKDGAVPVAVSRPVWPTGIAVRRFGDEHRLYATNKPPGKGSPSIELFLIEDDALRWKESFASPQLKFPNDVIVLADGSLCVTDIARGTVFAVDTATNAWTPLIRISQPNGLATDRAERYLFVNSFLCRKLRIFERATGKLKKTVSLPGFPDNLQWEIQDRLLDVALHTSIPRILGHMKISSNIRSPSRGCRIDVSSFLADEASDVRVERLYDLPDFSGGSAALVYDGTLYVSQVMGQQIFNGSPER